MVKNNKQMKEIKINGVSVKIELSKEEIKSFPKNIESTIRIKDKELVPISSKTVLF